MIYELRIPTTFEDNDAVRVLEWHGGPGTICPPGKLIVEVETHKALVEIRSDQLAILRQTYFEEGEWCPLGGLLATLSDDIDEPIEGALGEWAAEFRIG